MLDGQRYFSEFPEEERSGRMLLSEELRHTLAVIEREISEYIQEVAAAAAAADKNGCPPPVNTSR